MNTIEALRKIPDPMDLPSDHLRALWYDLNGDWDAAHSIVQRMSDTNAMWIHAYLHRKEPDPWNASYWYRNAGKPNPGDLDFDEEAEIILQELALADWAGPHRWVQMQPMETSGVVDPLSR